jgi:photosystem II stability/assembly factor-like uncharacterized protein
MQLKRAYFRVAALLIFVLVLSCTSFGASRWAELTTTYPSTNDLFSIYMTSLTSGCAVGEDDTIFLTTDGGLTWTGTQSVASASADLRRVRFSPSDPNLGFIAAADDAANAYFVRTTDGGVNWNSAHAYGSSGGWSVFVDELNNVWGCGNGLSPGSDNHVVHSTNEGDSYTVSGWGDSARPYVAHDIWFINETTGVAVGDRAIRRTTDEGQNWEIVLEEANGGTEFEALSFANSSIGWTAGDNGQVLKTTDGGINWVYLISGTGENLYDISFVNENTGWIVGENNGASPTIFRTTDGGSNWTWTRTGLPGGSRIEYIYGIHFIDEYNGWLVAHDDILNESVIYKWVTDPDVDTNGVYQSGEPSQTDIPQGYAGSIDIKGINMRPDATIDAGSGVTINSISASGALSANTGASTDTLTVNVTVSASAASGNRDLTIINPDTGISTYSAFAISNKPSVTSVSPESAYQGWSNTVLINGSDFVSGATADFGSEITVQSVSFVSATQLSAQISVPQSATGGTVEVKVTNPDNGEGSGSFEVLVAPNPPDITNIYFNTSPYHPITGTIEVSSTPTIKFDFTAPDGVSDESFRITVEQSSGTTVYNLPATAYSGSPTSGTVTYGNNGEISLSTGYSTITLYGEDQLGAGASQVCYVYVGPQPPAITSTQAITYPSPWNPNKGLVSIQVNTKEHLNNVKMRIIDISGQILHTIEHLDLVPGVNKVGVWDGNITLNGVVIGRVSQGMCGILIDKGAKKAIGTITVDYVHGN